MRGFVQESSIVSVIDAVAISGKGGSFFKNAGSLCSLGLVLDRQEQVAALASSLIPLSVPALLMHAERHWVPAGFSPLHARPAVTDIRSTP